MNKYILTRGDSVYLGDGYGWSDNESDEPAKFARDYAYYRAQQLANYDGESVEVWDGEPNSIPDTVRAEPRFVSVYCVTRHYGGPEEGGWWYNRYDLETSLPIAWKGPSADECELFLRRVYGDGEGNIYSVSGGHQYEYVREYERGQHQTKGRPHYE